MRFYHLLRAGITWKGPEVIELWYNAKDIENKGSFEEYDDDEDDDVSVLMCSSPDHKLKTVIESENEDYEEDKSAASGSDEDDSLLVAYDSNSINSVWHIVIKTCSKKLCCCCGQTQIFIFVILFIEIYAQICSLI